jgi:hypothetical protein
MVTLAGMFYAIIAAIISMVHHFHSPSKFQKRSVDDFMSRVTRFNFKNALKK